jgi:serine protease inhibitor
MTKTLTALKEYTKDFYTKTEFGESNVVGSPLGSWLLLASVASSLKLEHNPELKARLEKCLHMSIEDTDVAVREILATYPALNYVSQAWTTPDLGSLPAVQKWVEANTLIPHEGSIPSQKEIDEWASTNTNDLIKEFPAAMTGDTMLVIANIIYSKLAWKTKFAAIPATEAMSAWDVKTILQATATRDVAFYKNQDNDVFALYEVKASGENKESVVLLTCLSKDMEPLQLMNSLDSVSSMEPLLPNDELLLSFSEDMYKVKEVKEGSSPIVVEISVPAWDASSEHELFKNDALGYSEVIEAFNEDSAGSFAAEAKQVAVAKFDKDGFEAAALTTMLMARCAMPMRMTQTVYELNFSKPFAFVSYTNELPLFSGYIQNAKEGE